MFTRSRHAITAIILGVAAFSQITPADAVPIIRLTTSAGGSVTVMDGGSGDANTTAGAVTFVGSLAGWAVNVTTGLSKPLIGSKIRPKMDLNSVNVSGGSGWITIELTDTDFSLSMDSKSLSSIGGATDGTVTYSVFTDAANAAFAKTTAITSQGPFTPLAFSGSQAGTAGTDASFSITMITTITHANAFDVTSFNATYEVPEPGTLAILGFGLVGFGLARRRRKKRIAA